MFYTGINPLTMEKVYVPKTPQEKAMQRALLQYFNPKNRDKVIDALIAAGREDLIGTSPSCLVPPNAKYRAMQMKKQKSRTGGKRRQTQNGKQRNGKKNR